MKAWLVVKAFLKQKKFDEIHQWLCEAGKKHAIELEIKTNAELLSSCIHNRLALLGQASTVDFILFWDKDVMLAKTLEELGFLVYNSSFGIEACDNKALTHMYLSGEHILMPDTIIAPMTYANIGYTNLDFVEQVIEQIGLPLVIKECFGSFGQQVYLCNTFESVIERVKQLQGVPFLFQRFIEEADGRDVRLQVVGDQVVAAMERRAKPGDFRANITNGGSMRPYDPSKEEQNIALQCCTVLQVEFAGVDLLFDKAGKYLVCEVNSNAHFKNIYDCTGVNTADYIMERIVTLHESKKEN